MSLYIRSYVYDIILEDMEYCISTMYLTLICGYKIGGVSLPTHGVKLKIIYGSKMSKTANLDTISIHIHM